MTSQDELWKAIIEELLDDFLQFFFSNFYSKIDKSRPYEIMDKELSKLYPETKERKRRGDKLVKIPIKNGKDQFILIHLEVQGYKEENYGRRMYVCQYRIDERYNLPVAALVIYSDKNEQNRVSNYKRVCIDTELSYKFPIYVIADHSIKEYDKMDNPFAIICQTVLVGMNRNLKDEELLDLKVQLFRKLLTKNYSKERIRIITIFIKEYTNFGKKEFYSKFDSQIDTITENHEFMGIEETVIKYRSREAHKEGMEKGIEKGMEKGEIKAAAIKNYSHILNIFIKLPNLTILQISDLFDVDKAKIEKLKLILAYSSQEKMEKAIRLLFFENIELKEEEWAAILKLAKEYRKKIV